MSVGDGASGINYKDICPMCGEERGKYCKNVEDIHMCPNADADCKCNARGQDVNGDPNDTMRQSCIGHINGSVGIGTFLGSNIMLHRYSERSLKIKSKSFNPFKSAEFVEEVIKSNQEIVKAFREKGVGEQVIKDHEADFEEEKVVGQRVSQSWYKYDGHPLYVESGCIQAHHLICSEAMRDDKWRALCKMTGYNINCWKNGIFLPSLAKLACYVGVQCHKGPHRLGMGRFGNDSAYKSYVDCVKSELFQISQDIEEKGCTKNTKTNVIEDLNEISEEILDHIKEFEWTIAWDGLNYNHNTVPYIGCAGESTLNGKKNKIKKALSDSGISMDGIFWSGERAYEDMKKIEKRLEALGTEVGLCAGKEDEEHKKEFKPYDKDINEYKEDFSVGY